MVEMSPSRRPPAHTPIWMVEPSRPKGAKVLILGEQTLDVRQQIVHHFLVAAKAAACQHNAILSVDLEVIAVAVCAIAPVTFAPSITSCTLGAKQSGGIVREILLHIIVVVPAQVLQLQLTGGVVVLLAAGEFSQ